MRVPNINGMNDDRIICNDAVSITSDRTEIMFCRGIDNSKPEKKNC